MTFEVGGKQYIAIASEPSTSAKAKLVNTPELKDQRQAHRAVRIRPVSGAAPSGERCTVDMIRDRFGWEAVQGVLRHQIDVVV
jgi:hypothetical protein